MIESADLWLLRALYAGGSDTGWLDILLVLTFLGSGWMLLGLVPALFSAKMRTPTVTLLLTLAVTSGGVASAKALAGRVRPCNALGWLRALPIELPSDPSFPSGHAAGSFAFAAFVLTSKRRVGVALLSLASLIALSRVALGVHYPSDVMAGALLGAAMGWTGGQVSARLSASAAVGLTDADSESIRQ
jgi:undecaprenyl-diphosphatase